MKPLKCILAATLPLFLAGCLTVDTIQTRIQIREEGKPALLTITHLGFSSGEAKPGDVRKDFDHLISEWQGDEYLIARAKEGIVVRDRRVWEENGRINGSMTGLVEKIDGLYPFWERNGERILLVECEEEFDLAETNGRILKTENNRLIVWDAGEKVLSWTLRRNFESESIEKNRPRFARMFREYLRNPEN